MQNINSNISPLSPLLKNTYAVDDVTKASLLNDFLATVLTSMTLIPLYPTRLSEQARNYPKLLSTLVTYLMLQIRVRLQNLMVLVQKCFFEPRGEISHFWTKSLNRSLNMGIFRCSWGQKGNVTPIYINRNTSTVSNYMPISLLSCISKKFRRVVF